ncbi:MAG: hypothetical protein LBU27_01630 [Candidatus Peribacteria bacterium]|jgi:hypothetical protein|nr:hypothetical protein [Candidatus Peribacteria bacterium]
MFKFSFTHKVLLTLGISVLGFLGWSFAQENYTQQNDTCNQGDLMQQAFCRADNHSTVLNLGYTKKAVGNEIIKGSIKMTLDFDPNTKFLSANQSLIVRITRIFLSLVIVLSVTMIILNGI